jgi:hypothetical protein
MKSLFASFVLTAALTVPALGANTDTHTALPGTLNYVEGQALIGNEALNAQSIGSAQLEPGQTLTTERGKAEILLTPGVYLRLGSDSAAEMISPDLTNTQLQLNQGEALVEVDQIHPENNLRVRENGVDTQILKTGLYDFDAANNQVRVFDGKASVLVGDKKIDVKGGRELTLNVDGKLKATKFDKKKYEDNDLYRWSSLRSDYLAQANVSAAQVYVSDGWGAGFGPGWFGAGWYWSPWFNSFTFIPASGYLYSPFGWGFYSPLWVHAAPWYVYGNYPHTFANWRPQTVVHGAARAGVKPGLAYGPGFHGGAVRSIGRGAAVARPGAARTGSARIGGVRGGFGPATHATSGFGGFHAGGLRGGAVGGARR